MHHGGVGVPAHGLGGECPCIMLLRNLKGGLCIMLLRNLRGGECMLLRNLSPLWGWPINGNCLTHF